MRISCHAIMGFFGTFWSALSSNHIYTQIVSLQPNSTPELMGGPLYGCVTLSVLIYIQIFAFRKCRQPSPWMDFFWGSLLFSNTTFALPLNLDIILMEIK